MNLNVIDLKVSFLEFFFMGIFVYYTYFKITNNNITFNKIGIYILIAIISVTIIIVRNKVNNFIGFVLWFFLLSLMNCKIEKSNIGYAMLVTIIALSINYILLVIEIAFLYLINHFYVIKNDYANLMIMMVMHCILLYFTLKIKRIQNGISFLNKKANHEYFDVIILDASVCILFSIIIFSSRKNVMISRSLFVGFIIFAIVVCITIQKSIQLYYKHKLLVKELEDTKNELENKNKEVEKLEQENLSFSEKSHTLAHKQRVLEYKVNKLMYQTEIAEELDIKSDLEKISKELYGEKVTIELPKTGIEQIDTMISYMQSECEKAKIDYDVQITGNIYYMTNNLVTRDELEILLADHIKDAIIAVKHTDNINKSIMVRLGEIDDCYGLYIYDSGVEFEKEILNNLGKKPCTTHKDEGGTGLGFMNTFNTIKRHKASLVIKEIGKPCKENFTKVVMIKFDGKDEYKVISYR